jgi:Beta-galactosidase/beta-glucuronidase
MRDLCRRGLSSALAIASLVSALALLFPAALRGDDALMRSRTDFCSGWRFCKGDPAGASLGYAKLKDWMLWSAKSSVPGSATPARPADNIGGDLAYARPDYDDGAWRLLDLPHDWGIEGPFDLAANGDTGKLHYEGVGWYRKRLSVSAADLSGRVFLDFDGAMSYANVWVNGVYAGGWAYGYSSFRVEVGNYLHEGDDNLVAVHLDNPDASSRWYPGGGIYRRVWLAKEPKLRIERDGLWVSTLAVGPASASLEAKVELDNGLDREARPTLRLRVYEASGQGGRGAAVGASFPGRSMAIKAGGSASFSVRADLPQPRLWSPSSPNRYLLVATIEEGGRVVDELEQSFGIRSLGFDPDKGLMVNGEATRLQGVCLHHDLGELGAASNASAIRRRLVLLKELGCNAIRTSHNPPDPILLDLCDQMGFLVLDEAFDCWEAGKVPNDYHLLFSDWSELDLRSLVRRDRGHPSVIAWSIGNEVREQGNPAGRRIASQLAAIVRDEDPTRAVGAACDNVQAGFNGFASALDIFGYNYVREPGQYPRFHQANPKKTLFSSESASTISTRGAYAFPPPASFDKKLGGLVGGGPAFQMSSYDLYCPPWATTPDTEFRAQDESPFVAGEFVWTGFDYLGEPTHNSSPTGDGFNFARQAADPARSSYFGIFDLAGFKKDRFFLYQSRWRPDTPMAHILPHWNWPERLGKTVPVMVYTSGDSAELFLNDKSLGLKEKGRGEYRLRWDDVTYQPGELRVVAYKDGQEWATDSVRTAGPAAKLTLEADRPAIAADGRALCFITVSVLDAEGRPVPRADNLLSFEVSGGAELVALNNGDPTSLVSFRSPSMKAFGGLCLAVLRAKPGAAGPLVLVAKAKGLGEARIELGAISPNASAPDDDSVYEPKAVDAPVAEGSGQ